MKAASRSWFQLAAAVLLAASSTAAAGWSWNEASDGTFTVMTAAAADASRLSGIFAELRAAQLALGQQPGSWKLQPCMAVKIWIHPDLESFTSVTGLPWFVLASADRESCELHLQRLVVVLERSSLAVTLRHELFHLAQPDSWSRWLAEGRAMHFAGERPGTPPLPGISDGELDRLLANPPDAATLARAAATAFQRVLHHR